MIKEWIEQYDPKNEEEILFALREIMQEIALAGLSRTDFFEKAVFYGGTALRIFYGLDRFSEDLDFSLLQSNLDFKLDPYFSSILNEFESLGIHVSIKEKQKSIESTVESAFLKAETIWKEIVLEDLIKQIGVTTTKSIKIKIEVDRNPPLLFSTEERLLIRPFSFYVKCFSKPSLFAGKMHALLYRKWKNRVKGRDWYDLEWYIKNGIPLDLNHFLKRAQESGDWINDTITEDQVIQLLKEKIMVVSIDQIKDDVIIFIKDDRKLEIWSRTYFINLIDQLKFKDELK